ncbi:MAG: rhodanese-like domain-containing protein [Desulfarculus sp.]|jgi:rhodanese-related sulfurtransferase|nr:MAG: rhodanese-like domain-containing protein [Desulfarculus sp.]
MQIAKLIQKAPSLSPAELRRFMDQHPPGSYTLLDVRQPKEYEERHLPGAKLIPLPELNARLRELDRSQPVVAY